MMIKLIDLMSKGCQPSHTWQH